MLLIMFRTAELPGSSVLMTSATITGRTTRMETEETEETEETGPSRPGTRGGGALAFPDRCLLCACADLLASGLGTLASPDWPRGCGRRL